MNLATLIQSQNFATLLAALTASGDLTPGKTIQAQLLSIEPDGTATALVNGTSVSLVLAGPQAQQAALAPGATLVLKLAQADAQGGALKATLVSVQPPTAAPTAPQAGAAAASASAKLLPTTILEGSAPATTGRIQIQSAQPLPQAEEATAVQPSPRALAGPLVGAAIARQDSLAPLLANLRAVATGNTAFLLPQPLLAAAEQVLAHALPADRQPVTAQTLKAAIAHSGLFAEARAVQALSPTPTADLKTALQALQTALVPLGRQDAAAQAAPVHTTASESPAIPAALRPAAPRIDGPLVAQPVADATLSSSDKLTTIAGALLDQTEAALDRVTLSQYASLPVDAPRLDGQASQRWLTELPLAFQHGVAIMPLQIEKEPPHRDAPAVQAPVWRVRFALDVEPMGPLQGVVTLQGRSVGVSIWAEREETSKMLRAASPALEASLVQARFENGSIEIQTGQPRIRQATAGQFLDRRS